MRAYQRAGPSSKLQRAADFIRNTEQNFHGRDDHGDLFGASPGADFVIGSQSDFKIHDELEPGIDDGGLADKGIPVTKGINVLCRGPDDGKDDPGFFIVCIQIHAVMAEQRPSRILEIIEIIAMDISP